MNDHIMKIPSSTSMTLFIRAELLFRVHRSSDLFVVKQSLSDESFLSIHFIL